MSTIAVTTPVSIRRCRRTDLPDLEWHGMFAAHRRIITDTFDASERGEQLMLVAASDRWSVGQVWVDLVRRAASRVGLVWALRVHPFFSGHGIGGGLLAAAERATAEHGYTGMEIEVEPENDIARRLYTRMGYVSSRTYLNDWMYETPDGAVVVERRTLVAMVKPIASAALMPGE